MIFADFSVGASLILALILLVLKKIKSLEASAMEIICSMLAIAK